MKSRDIHKASEVRSNVHSISRLPQTTNTLNYNIEPINRLACVGLSVLDCCGLPVGCCYCVMAVPVRGVRGGHRGQHGPHPTTHAPPHSNTHNTQHTTSDHTTTQPCFRPVSSPPILILALSLWCTHPSVACRPPECRASPLIHHTHISTTTPDTPNTETTHSRHRVRYSV